MNWEKELEDSITIPAAGSVSMFAVRLGRYVMQGETEAFRDSVVRELKDFVRRVLHHHLEVMPHTDPPMNDQAISSLEWFVENHPDMKVSGDVKELKTMAKMIRWQQSVIAFLARETGFKEMTDAAYHKGVQDEKDRRKEHEREVQDFLNSARP